MTDSLLFALILITALGCGLAGGVFFAFSTFVMKALGRLPPAQGIAAMQAINVTAVTPLFMTALFGTAAASLVLAVSALLAWHQPGADYLLVGGAIYIAGDAVVTMVINVPLNTALAAVAPDSDDGARLWQRYLTKWTTWNHVRTVAGMGAAAAFILALVQRYGA